MKESDADMKMKGICRKYGISSPTYYGGLRFEAK